MSEPEKLPESHKLRSVLLRQAVASGTRSSLTVGDKDILSLQPAALGPDGDWYAVDKGQRADGIGVRAKQRSAVGSFSVRRSLIPWSNIDEIGYGD